MKPLALAAALLATLALPATALAADYLPLQPGNAWRFAAPGGMRDTHTVAAPILVAIGANSYLCHPLLYADGGPDAGLVNFMLSGPDGSVLIAGWARPGFGLLYDPPVRLVAAPLVLGKSWQDDAMVIPIYGGAPSPLHLDWQVMEAGPLAVPAGVFFAYGIGQFLPAAPGDAAAATSRFDLFGRERGADGAQGGPAPQDWWVEGLGRVQYQTIDLFQLASYRLASTGVEPASWSTIKRLYR